MLILREAEIIIKVEHTSQINTSRSINVVSEITDLNGSIQFGYCKVQTCLSVKKFENHLYKIYTPSIFFISRFQLKH